MKHLFGTPDSAALSRRGFLKGTSLAAGAFVIGCYLPFRSRQAFAQEGGIAEGSHDPNVFVRVGPDNTVTVISKHFEMGQGVTTGLATLVAEELGADWSTLRFEFAPNDPERYANLVFGVMATGGTTSMLGSWVQMRRVGAAARMMFAAAAASAWRVPAGEITIEKSVIRHPASGRSASLGEMADAAMEESVPADIPLKDPKDWMLIGRPIPRLDSHDKTNGAATFALDVRRPGALIAMVKRPPQFGATVADFDDREARAVDGVVEVVQIPSGIAVLARDNWSAMRGRDALAVSWDTGGAETRSSNDILDEYRTLASGPGLSAAKRGNPKQKLADAKSAIEAEFTFPYLAHTPMEPLNCVMELNDDGAEIWSGCQLQSIDTFMAAQTLGLKPEQIRINTLLGGGSFGRRGNPVADWVVELASIVKAIDGRAPVHAVWTREDDVRGGFYRPMALHKVEVGIDGNSMISGWRHRLVSKSIFTGTPFEQMAVHDGIDHSSVEGIGDSPYKLPDFELRSYNAQSPVPVLWWRSVGHSHNAHVMETMIDEVAQATGRDPVKFRLELLEGKPRDRATLELAAERAGWDSPMPRGKGRGVAYHFSFGTRVAMVAEVTVTDRTLKVDRIVAAVDCGVAINPDVVTAQVEGAIGFGLSAVTRNAITLDDGFVRQSNFHNFEPTRMREMPTVDVHIVPSTEDPSGVGEPGVPPLAPAIGNAVYAATGVRLRSLPLDLGRLKKP